MGDLPLYRDLIDAYDKVVSSFANDMEDVQEVIFVIKNYGGTDKTEFMSDLKKSKLIKVEGDGGVDTIRAEIPFEARNAFWSAPVVKFSFPVWALTRIRRISAIRPVWRSSTCTACLN